MGFDYKDINRLFTKKGSEVTVFELADQDDETDPQYFGYTNSEGAWIIRKYDRSVSPATNRFAHGYSSYTAAWAARGSLSYGYYHAISG